MTEQIAVLYDDGCPLCTFQMRLLTWLDWKERLRLIPLSHPEASRLAPTLTREQLLEAIHCVGPEGDMHRGARALRYIGARLPAMVPLALILWIPGVIWVAEKVYMTISANRHLLSKWFGCKGACQVMPAKKGRQDEELVAADSGKPTGIEESNTVGAIRGPS